MFKDRHFLGHVFEDVTSGRRVPLTIKSECNALGVQFATLPNLNVIASLFIGSAAQDPVHLSVD